jgi:hypothetical protein
MYIFLDAAVQPHSLVIYKWCKATPDNCDAARHAHPRPCFTPEFIGGHPAQPGVQPGVVARAQPGAGVALQPLV